MADNNPEVLAEQFVREERFIVIKRKHLVGDQEIAIRNLLENCGIQTVECVVVESDWPEYETVWAMIEARCTGRAPAVSEEAVAEAIWRSNWQGSRGPDGTWSSFARDYPSAAVIYRVYASAAIAALSPTTPTEEPQS